MNQDILELPLRNSTLKVKMSKADYDILKDQLKLNLDTMQLRQGQVVVRSNSHSQHYLNVTRLILDVGPGMVTRFLNQDYRDLRRSNLVLVKGGAKSRTRDLL